MKTKTVNKLTMAQVYTLRRLSSGTQYVLRGDCKKADERRPDGRGVHPVSAPSIPVLYRMGLVEFNINRGKDPSLYSRVRLTDAGKQAVKETKDREQ